MFKWNFGVSKEYPKMNIPVVPEAGMFWQRYYREWEWVYLKLDWFWEGRIFFWSEGNLFKNDLGIILRIFDSVIFLGNEEGFAKVFWKNVLGTEVICGL